MNKMRKQVKGFTLVEILIVVIILGILAAIVIPQFTEASTSAKESSLVSNLQTLRSQVGLYKIQHNDMLPSCTASDTATHTDATAVQNLTSVTDVDGELWAAGAVGKFGPYMQAIPENPFITTLNTPSFSFGTAAVAPGDDSSHWYINTDTGAISANDSKSTPDDPPVAHTLL